MIGYMLRPEVGNGSTKYGCVLTIEGFCHGLIHLVATLYVYSLDALAALQAHRTGYQRYLRAPFEALLSQGEAHLTAGEVAYKAHGVYAFIRRSGRNKDMLALQ